MRQHRSRGVLTAPLLRVLALVLPLLGLTGCPRPPVRQPLGSAPLPSCREAWARLPPGAADYDFRADSSRTPQGNLGYAAYAARVDRRHCRKPWAVLVYMAADNDLYPYAQLNLYEMEAGGARGAASSADADVLVRLDGPGRAGLRRLHMFQTEEPLDAALTRESFAQRSESALRSPVVALDPEPAVFDLAADLREFLRWAVNEYPADHTMVVVWGHGGGWGLGPATAASPPPAKPPAAEAEPLRYAAEQDPFPLLGGIAFNWTRRTYLGVPALRQVLRDVVAGPLGGRPIDVYLADACLMQSLEVTTELSDVARFVVGSIQVQDYLGMSYRDLLQRINNPAHGMAVCAGRPDEEACSVAAALPALYDASLQTGLRAALSPQAVARFTLSAVRSAALRDALLPATAELGRALSAYVVEDGRQLGTVQQLLPTGDSQSFLGNARDLGAFLRLLAVAVDRQAQRRPRTAAGGAPVRGDRGGAGRAGSGGGQRALGQRLPGDARVRGVLAVAAAAGRGLPPAQRDLRPRGLLSVRGGGDTAHQPLAALAPAGLLGRSAWQRLQHNGSAEARPRVADGFILG